LIKPRSGFDTTEKLVNDLRPDPRLDDSHRRFVVEEMGKWMFGEPLQDEFGAALHDQ